MGRITRVVFNSLLKNSPPFSAALTQAHACAAALLALTEREPKVFLSEVSAVYSDPPLNDCFV